VQKRDDEERAARSGWGSVARTAYRILREEELPAGPRKSASASASASAGAGRGRPRPAGAAPEAALPPAAPERPARPARRVLEKAAAAPGETRKAPARRSPAAGTKTATTNTAGTKTATTKTISSAAPARTPGRRRGAAARGVPEEIGEELRAIGGAKLAADLVPKLTEAARAYEHDRYRDALAMLKRMAERAPESPSVRELLGLTLYRLGRWRDAMKELNAYFELSGSYDQYPVMADCQRALGRHREVERLWTELRQAGVSSDLLAEGRLVAAGSLADRGQFEAAIAMLGPSATRSVRRPEVRHVRQWYALADIYERAGEIPRARELFIKVVEADPQLSDAPERLAALR
jgi:Flp pilus assembly protein TadD